MPRWQDLKSISLKTWLILLALPCINLIAVAILRDHAGPFWMWSNLDPDYFYVFDSLNIANLDWPVAIHHPGTPLQVLGALILKISHPLSSPEQLTEFVLKNPEHYLGLIHLCLVIINTAALIFAGVCAYLAFGDRLAVVFVQLGPFISKLSIKWMTHVAPEALLISVVLVLSGIALLAIRQGQLNEHRKRYAVLFGVIAGFGMATKITSIGIYFLPVFILWNFRSLAIYGGSAALAILVFTLPAAGSYGDIIAHINNISVGSTEIGVVKKSFIDFTQYPSELIRVSSRPAFFMVLLAGLITIGYLAIRSKTHEKEFPIAGKLLAGLCMADIVQALIVAKHPSGHYMIPVLTLSTLGMALLYRVWLDQRQSGGSNGRYLQVFFSLLFVGLVGAQTSAGLKLDRQFKERVIIAAQVDDTRFDKCARIYFWSAAAPSYALQLGNDMVRNKFSEKLDQLRPANDFWFEVARKEFRDWKGIRDVKDMVSPYPCIFARGLYPALIEPSLRALLPSRRFETQCSLPSGHETIFTSGVDCAGKLQ